MTYDSTPQGFKTMLGTSVAEATQALDAAGADVVGTNCGNDMDGIVRLAQRMRLFTKKPLLVRANAGVPQVAADKISFQDTPETMAARIGELKAAGVSIVGGCCGTTPEHIRRFRTAMDGLKKGLRPEA